MRDLALEQQSGDPPVSSQKQQSFRILVEPPNGMRALGEVKVEVAQ